MEATSQTTWSFPAQGLSELQIRLANATLRVRRGDTPDVTINVGEDEEIGSVLQAELDGNVLTVTQRGAFGSWRPQEGWPGAEFDDAIGGFVDGMFGVVDEVVDAVVEGLSPRVRVRRPPPTVHGRGSERPNSRPRWPSHHNVDITVSLPPALETISLAAKLDRGDVEVLSVYGDLALRTGMGNVHLTQCGREISAKTGRGSLIAADCSGRLDLHTGMGDVTLTACQGAAEVHSGNGTVRLERCQLAGNAHTGHGNLWLESIVGSGTYRTGAGTLTAVSPAGEDLDLQSGMGDVVVQGGRVDRLRANSGAGNVRCAGIHIARDLDLHTGMGNLSVRGGSAGRLRMKGGAGNVECITVLGQGEHELETGAGNIEVRLPDNARVRVDAVSRMGSVQSDFNLVKVGRPGPVTIGGGRFVGSIGDGDAVSTLHLKTGAGNIAIRRTRESWPVAGDKVGQTAATPADSQDVPPSSSNAVERTRLAVLHSLQRGEITVEEAMALLERAT